MLQSSERETEILLGNKQLLGIFFVVAALLGIAFVGGYKVGQASAAKKAAASASSTASDTAAQNSGVTQPGGETHSVSPADGGVLNTDGTSSAASQKGAQELLGARKKRLAKPEASNDQSAAAPARADTFAPQNGQEFLQVAAVPHDHALAVAAVLRKKGFHAHAVPKPGAGNLYRVIVGPIHDAGELSSTRDSLRKTGFSQVIVQHYQE
jgi:cell division septation protein DedD